MVSFWMTKKTASSTRYAVPLFRIFVFSILFFSHFARRFWPWDRWLSKRTRLTRPILFDMHIQRKSIANPRLRVPGRRRLESQ